MNQSRDIADFISRCDEIIELGNQALQSLEAPSSSKFFNSFRSAALSFISMTYGPDHTYYDQFMKIVLHERRGHVFGGIGIMDSIRIELQGGWLTNARKLISAEIFSDYIEMAGHLLKEDYKDAAAVIIGSTLEAHLRQLCVQNNIDTEIHRNGKVIPKKADRINADLAKVDVFGKLDQKLITGWLDLRNNAAHGNYDAYTKEQVDNMLHGVTDFMIRVPT